MHKILFFVVAITLVACQSKSANENIQQQAAKQQEPTNQYTFKEAFNKLQSAIIQEDIITIKSFIKFPFASPALINEIWRIAGDEKAAQTGKEFTEEDFDKHVGKLLPKGLKLALQQVDFMAFEKGNNIEISLQVDDSIEAYLSTAYDENSKQLILTYIEHNNKKKTTEFAWVFEVINDSFSLYKLSSAM